jgi:hypothetical protein
LSISGSPVQYAGGGGGSNGDNVNGTLGGGGGGGNGSGAFGASYPLPTNAIANTGGGGGASGAYSGSTPAGQAGGSGIVVIRYPSYLAPATSTTGSPETYTTGGWRVYKFVASGTITF